MSEKKTNETKLEQIQAEKTNERRDFIKKAVYKAPVLIAMGQLLRPNQAEAGFGPPPSAPAGGGW